MSSILSKIHDDMERYKELCEHFKEEPQHKPDAYGIQLLDCYGEHSKLLEERIKGADHESVI